MEGKELTRGLGRSCPQPLPSAPGQGSSETGRCAGSHHQNSPEINGCHPAVAPGDRPPAGTVPPCLHSRDQAAPEWMRGAAELGRRHDRQCARCLRLPLPRVPGSGPCLPTPTAPSPGNRASLGPERARPTPSHGRLQKRPAQRTRQSALVDRFRPGCFRQEIIARRRLDPANPVTLHLRSSSLFGRA
jgi:hypothetical protein